LVERHRQNDAKSVEPDLAAKTAQRQERLDREAARIKAWPLPQRMPDWRGRC